MGGNPFSGALRLGSFWFLAGIGLFVVLLATTSTFLYLEQARLVAQLFLSTEERVRIFSLLDFIVQILAVLPQLFFTGRMARRLGLCFLLGMLPLLVCVGFLLLAWSPGFVVLAAVMVLRRAGEYALIRPGREMLFTTVDVEAKYKVKNFIDTVVYRGGDAAGSWLKAGVNGLGYGGDRAGRRLLRRTLGLARLFARPACRACRSGRIGRRKAEMKKATRSSGLF